MYTLAELESINLDPLALPQRIEVSTSVHAYLGEYARYGLNVPAWLENLQREVRGLLREAQKEQEIAVVAAARQRVRNRLPFAERQQVILAEIAALEEERQRI